VLIEGILGVQKECVLASKRSIITVEEVVDDLGAGLNACILPHWAVGAICVVKGGAFPSYAQGYYARNNAFYIGWDKIARDKETFHTWMKENVLNKTPQDFAQLAGV
jgi:glutaconate CoA-transferase, subunit A